MEGSSPVGTAGDLTRSLAAGAAATRYEELPESVHQVARQCVLDFLAVTLAGSGDPLTTILFEDAKAEGGLPLVTVIGRADRLPPLAASLVNGAASHALDYDDVNLAMPGHPSVAVLPGLLALAEQRQSSGRALIEALVAGYEAQCRIGLMLKPGHYDLGFHATGTVGAFGAAAACARLLGLDRDATAAALGIAGTQAAGLKSMFGTMCKPFHAGKAAMNGLAAARLAARGFTTRADVLECAQGFALTHGPDFVPERARAEPPLGFYILANLFKYHAACYLTHASLENAGRLRGEQGVRLDQVKRATIRMDRGCDRVCNIPAPSDGLETKFSVRHVTVMALDGIDTARLDVYNQANAADPRYIEARGRVAIDFQEGWPEAKSELVLELADGRRLETGHDAGIPLADLDAQQAKLDAKFRALVAPVLGTARAEELRAAVLGLDALDDVGALLRAAAA